MHTDFLTRLSRQKPKLTLTMTDRLPSHVHGPVILTCTWECLPQVDYVLLSLTLDGTLTLHCQRCGEVFSTHFHHENKIALCKTTLILDQLMRKMDCLLLDELPSDLTALVTDELHLYAPEKHDVNCP